MKVLKMPHGVIFIRCQSLYKFVRSPLVCRLLAYLTLTCQLPVLRRTQFFFFQKYTFVMKIASYLMVESTDFTSCLNRWRFLPGDRSQQHQTQSGSNSLLHIMTYFLSFSLLDVAYMLHTPTWISFFIKVFNLKFIYR